MKTVDSQVKWQGKSWRVRVETLEDAAGNRMERGKIEHPGSIVLIPMLGEDVVMIRQFRPNIQKTILELPAGTCDWGEDRMECAQRELREETGYRADELIPVMDCYPAPGYSDEEFTFFLARGLTHDPLPMDADEEIENAPLPLEELVQMAVRGEIPDAKSVVGLLRVQDFLINES